MYVCPSDSLNYLYCGTTLVGYPPLVGVPGTVLVSIHQHPQISVACKCAFLVKLLESSNMCKILLKIVLNLYAYILRKRRRMCMAVPPLQKEERRPADSTPLAPKLRKVKADENA